MNWFDWLKNQALVTFPNMPSSFIENAILNAVSRFFRETHLMKDEAYIDAECGTNDYVIDLPDGRTIVQIKSVHSTNDPDRHPLLDRNWCIVPPAEERFGNGYWVELQFEQPAISFEGCGSVRSGKYCVVYSWTPTGQDCDIPHHFFGKYRNDILNGVLASLYLIPMENDSQSAAYAQYYNKEFLRGINIAHAEEFQNHTNRPMFMHGGCFL
jgi:hypothetical protein